MGFTPSFLEPVAGAWLALKRFWVETLGQGDAATLTESTKSLISVPFVDYARGDGKSVGPGQDDEWSPVIISDEIDWVDKYRGLWGLDTHDPFGGERAPAGPKYNRDGSVRQSWYDPIGWAGIDKLYPPAQIPDKLLKRIESVSTTIADLEAQIEDQREKLRDLALDLQTLGDTESAGEIYDDRLTGVTHEQEKLQLLQKQLVHSVRLRKALQLRLDKVGEAEWGAPDAHIHHHVHPEPPLPLQPRAIEIWAALSGALALLAIGAVLIFRPVHWLTWILIIAVTFGAMEAFLRRRLSGYLTTITIILAVIAGIILFIEFWDWIILVCLVAVAIFMMRDNLREVLREH